MLIVNRSNLALISVVLMLAMIACDPVDAVDKIGISLTPTSGDPVIHWVLCEGEKVEMVSVGIQKGDVLGDGDDHIIWKIVSRSGSTRSDFVVGRQPPTFYTVIHLQQDLLEAPHLTALVRSTGNTEPVFFSLSKLKVDAILTFQGDYLSKEAFIDRAKGACRS